MANQFKRPDSSTGQGLLWLFGAILVIQGFGSAITEAGWDTSFGVAAISCGQPICPSGQPSWSASRDWPCWEWRRTVTTRGGGRTVIRERSAGNRRAEMLRM